MTVKPDGSSAPDAGKAKGIPDLNLVDSKEQPQTPEQKQEQIPTAPASEEVTVEETEETVVEPEGSQEPEEETPEVPDLPDEATEEEKAAHLQEKQEKHAARKIQEVTAKLASTEKRLKAFEDTQERLVRGDANYLFTVAQADPELADRLVAKIFGSSHNVETLEELKLLAERNKADDRYKPLYDRQLKIERELRAYRKEKADEKSAEQKQAISKFRASHADFKGEIQKATLEIQESSNGKYDLAKSYIMAKALLTENITPEEPEEDLTQKVKNKVGARGNSSSKAAVGKGKILTAEQVSMAKRMRNDPAKVYSS